MTHAATPPPRLGTTGWGAGAGLPARTGLSLKPEHFRAVLEQQPDVGFFEVHAENYMVDGGPYHHYLGRIRERHALSLHGVGLSIGGEAPLEGAHVVRLAALVDRYQPAAFSEHLAWSSHGGSYLADLLPLPYNRDTLDRVCRHVDQLQSSLRRRMLLENPSTYLEFDASTMDEAAFLREIVLRTGCGLLLDINNVHVSCINRGADAQAYLDEIPVDAVGEIHIAGFDTDRDAAGAPLLVDSHGAAVDETVWQLYARWIDRAGPGPTLLERDHDIPPLDALLVEAGRAQRIMSAFGEGRDRGNS